MPDIFDVEALPIGFTMELARHPDVLEKFSRLSRQDQQSVIAGARSIETRSKMRQYVESFFDELLPR